MSEQGDNVTPIAAAFEKAQKRKRRNAPAEKPPEKTPATTGGGHYSEVVEPPKRLPPNSPVTALGHCGDICYFLDCAGQFTPKPAEKLGRLPILKLFGGVEYLSLVWPTFDGNGKLKPDAFDHARIAPVLISSCVDRGLFDPMTQVRGLGAWREDDGGLVMHCGESLYTVAGRAGTGLRRDYLYPAAPATPSPLFEAPGGIDGPAWKLLDQLHTWNWAREHTDAKLLLGWIGAAMLGGAPDWRPMAWITGERGTGKSTLQKLIRWLFGKALIHAEDASRAGIFQKAGYSSLPVALDELEAKADNRKAQDIIELARIAASGGVVLRGGADGTPSEFTARNCFLFSSINIPPLRAADRSRMAILELNPLGANVNFDEDAIESEDDDPILGPRLPWERAARALRGRLLFNWHRYPPTLRAYRKELMKAGHDARAADQFGSLGAAYDLLLHDALDPAAAASWAAMLPAKTLAETSGFVSDDRACLNHLMTCMPAMFREGAKFTLAEWFARAKKERSDAGSARDDSDVNRVLRNMGLALHRDARDAEQWWIVVSNDHQELAKVFTGTHWGGLAGAPGTWRQALRRIKYARETRLRIGGDRHYCVAVPYEAYFAPKDAALDAEEEAFVDKRDRE